MNWKRLTVLGGITLAIVVLLGAVVGENRAAAITPATAPATGPTSGPAAFIEYSQGGGFAAAFGIVVYDDGAFDVWGRHGTLAPARMQELTAAIDRAFAVKRGPGKRFEATDEIFFSLSRRGVLRRWMSNMRDVPEEWDEVAHQLEKIARESQAPTTQKAP